jgi:hypothetical protein
LSFFFETKKPCAVLVAEIPSCRFPVVWDTGFLIARNPDPRYRRPKKTAYKVFF